ncbi:MAG: hypothetical protein JWM95_5038 [Gemmatimonadetes bacterium]|nr:hypothetical protein [Gemmatimonadota bacterium]
MRSGCQRRPQSGRRFRFRRLRRVEITSHFSYSKDSALCNLNARTVIDGDVAETYDRWSMHTMTSPTSHMTSTPSGSPRAALSRGARCPRSWMRVAQGGTRVQSAIHGRGANDGSRYQEENPRAVKNAMCTPFAMLRATMSPTTAGRCDATRSESRQAHQRRDASLPEDELRHKRHIQGRHGAFLHCCMERLAMGSCPDGRCRDGRR